MVAVATFGVASEVALATLPAGAEAGLGGAGAGRAGACTGLALTGVALAGAALAGAFFAGAGLVDGLTGFADFFAVTLPAAAGCLDTLPAGALAGAFRVDTGFAAAFFTATFLTAGLLAGVFFATAFFAGVLLAGAGFAAAFFVTGFFGAGFLATALAGAFLATGLATVRDAPREVAATGFALAVRVDFAVAAGLFFCALVAVELRVVFAISLHHFGRGGRVL